MKPFKIFPILPEENKQNPMQLKVLISGPLPPPLGGIATYFKSLLSSSLPERVNLRFVQSSTHNRELSQSGRVTTANLFSAMDDCMRFFWAAATYRPQICHITTAFGLSFIKNSVFVGIARVFGSRVLLHPRCGLSALYFDRPWWWKWLFCQVVRMTNGVIGLSSEWKQLPQIVHGSRFFFLSNAINLAPYLAIAQDRFKKSTQDGVIKVLFLGYIGQAKGSFDLLEAIQKIEYEGSEIVFDFVGDELRKGEINQLRERILKAGLDHMVRLHQPVIDEAKLACFRNADVFVYPSYSEGLPIAVIEAMASGLPIVASNVGGLPDLVREGENGFIVDPGSPDQLAIGLQKVIADRELRHSMGKSSCEFANEHYDIEQHVVKLVEIYEKSI